MSLSPPQRFGVRTVEHLFVPLPDGTRLAARAWLPRHAPPRPVVVEYLPYRKRDGTRRRDETIHPVLAAQGYPALRVDVRGTGDSEGVLLDEYHPQEIDDGVALLAWVAAQPFCDGRVVLLGKSWGGINALMIAARRPKEVAGVVSVCATDDRYANDAHYMGGRLLAENLIWGVGLMAVAAHPPDPPLFGPVWRDMWMRRLDAVRPFPAVWMAHPQSDAYWRRDSAREAASRITCPVLLVGGTEDPYRDAIPRLLEGLGGPSAAILGPWAHLYPHLGRPGPALDFPRLLVQWLDRHVGPQAMSPAEPRLTAYLTEGGRGPEREGRWVAARGALDADEVPLHLGLADGRLIRGPSLPGTLVVASPLETGLCAGGWCRFGARAEGPYDQGEDDLRSVVFDLPPLEEPLDVLGVPVFRAATTEASRGGLLCARLVEVLPDGRSERIAYGLRDLTARRGPLEIPLELTAHRVRRGSRLRLALSSAYWPVAWPLPGDGPVPLLREACSLELPQHGHDRAAPLPEGFPFAPRSDLRSETDADGFRRTIARNPRSGEIVVRGTSDLDPEGSLQTALLREVEIEHGHGVEEEFRLRPEDPSSARGRVRHVFRVRVPGLELAGTATGSVETVDGCLVFHGALEASENGREVFRRTWSKEQGPHSGTTS